MVILGEIVFAQTSLLIKFCGKLRSVCRFGEKSFRTTYYSLKNYTSRQNLSWLAPPLPTYIKVQNGATWCYMLPRFPACFSPPSSPPVTAMASWPMAYCRHVVQCQRGATVADTIISIQNSNIFVIPLCNIIQNHWNLRAVESLPFCTLGRVSSGWVACTFWILLGLFSKI